MAKPETAQLPVFQVRPPHEMPESEVPVRIAWHSVLAAAPVHVTPVASSDPRIVTLVYVAEADRLDVNVVHAEHCVDGIAPLVNDCEYVAVLPPTQVPAQTVVPVGQPQVPPLQTPPMGEVQAEPAGAALQTVGLVATQLWHALAGLIAPLA